MGATHGNVSTYRNPRYACRCGECRDASTRRRRQEMASRRARLAADPSVVQHGRASTYTNWGCRCDDCKAANSAWLAARRAPADTNTKESTK